VAEILLGVSASLNEVHRAKMIYRDIKPKNLVLAKLGLEYDFVKGLDFGLVKLKYPKANDQPQTNDGTAKWVSSFRPVSKRL